MDALQGRLREVVRLAEGLRHAGPTTEWEKHKLWDEDPVMAALQGRAARSAARPAIAGPSTRKAAEVLSKYIITDMYAKAVQGMPAEDAVKWAEGELKKVYV